MKREFLSLWETLDKSSVWWVHQWCFFRLILVKAFGKKEWDLRNENSIAECLRHSDIVFNFTGRDFATKYARCSHFPPSSLKLLFPHRNFDIRSVNAVGAGRIAKISAESGVSQFYQLSHLNASANSPSELYRAKAEGEELVRAAFPTATIIRPATMFGYEDKLLNNMAGKRLYIL